MSEDNFIRVTNPENKKSKTVTAPALVRRAQYCFLSSPEVGGIIRLGVPAWEKIAGSSDHRDPRVAKWNVVCQYNGEAVSCTIGDIDNTIKLARQIHNLLANFVDKRVKTTLAGEVKVGTGSSADLLAELMGPKPSSSRKPNGGSKNEPPAEPPANPPA